MKLKEGGIGIEWVRHFVSSRHDGKRIGKRITDHNTLLVAQKTYSLNNSFETPSFSSIFFGNGMP